jgi:hypothetical protein
MTQLARTLANAVYARVRHLPVNYLSWYTGPGGPGMQPATSGERSEIKLPALSLRRPTEPWDAGLMLTPSDVWMAVYDWGGYDYDNPPPDETAVDL